eukprot:5904565-Prymnesium_polylepis.2
MQPGAAVELAHGVGGGVRCQVGGGSHRLLGQWIPARARHPESFIARCVEQEAKQRVAVVGSGGTQQRPKQGQGEPAAAQRRAWRTRLHERPHTSHYWCGEPTTASLKSHLTLVPGLANRWP